MTIILVDIITILLEEIAELAISPEEASELAEALNSLRDQCINEPEEGAQHEAKMWRIIRPYQALASKARSLFDEDSDELRSRNMNQEATTKGLEMLPAANDLGAVSKIVTRYTDISCPTKVWLKAPRFTVVVRLTVTPSEHSAVVEEMNVKENLPVQVRITAPAFTIIGGPEKSLPVLPDIDSEISFDLQPRYPGNATISFDFRQEGRPVGTASVSIEISQAEVSSSAVRSAAQLLQIDPSTPPPHRMLYIAHELVNGEHQLHFTLYQEGEQHGRGFEPVPLRGKPQEHARFLYERLTALTNRAAGGHNSIAPAEVTQSVQELGQNLWEELIPYDLKTLYGAERASWHGSPLLLVSDEPHIPWELVWPYDVSWADDAPWNITCRLTRWLRRSPTSGSQAGPVGRLHLGTFACIAPTDSGLTFAHKERAFLQEFAQAHHFADCSPSKPDTEAVRALLTQGEYQWLHVASHGNFDTANPNEEAIIYLNQRQPFVPHQFVGPAIKAHVSRAHPGYFFNTCHGARQSWSITQMGGWPQRLIGFGAGFFAAPLWTVTDELALKFAQSFYASLVNEKSVSEAIYEARQAAFKEGDPTWLAYSVYAHPNAKITVNI